VGGFVVLACALRARSLRPHRKGTGARRPAHRSAGRSMAMLHRRRRLQRHVRRRVCGLRTQALGTTRRPLQRL